MWDTTKPIVKSRSYSGGTVAWEPRAPLVMGVFRFQEVVWAAPRKTSWGMLADLGPAPSAEDIDEMRREVWGKFPREDV